MINSLLVSLVLLALFPMILASKQFYTIWSNKETYHWQEWGSPSFGKFYSGMIFIYFPLIYGNECEKLNNKELMSKRNQILYSKIAFVFFIIFQSFIEF